MSGEFDESPEIVVSENRGAQAQTFTFRHRASCIAELETKNHRRDHEPVAERRGPIWLSRPASRSRALGLRDQPRNKGRPLKANDRQDACALYESRNLAEAPRCLLKTLRAATPPSVQHEHIQSDRLMSEVGATYTKRVSRTW